MASRQRRIALGFESLTDVTATVTALALIPVVFVSFREQQSDWVIGGAAADWIIWTVFLADALAKFAVHGGKWIRRPMAWLDLAIVLVTFPQLPAVLGYFGALRVIYVARIAQIMRLVSLARVVVLLQRAALGLRRFLSPAAFPLLFLMALSLIMVSAAALQMAESAAGHPLSLGEAMWWAVVTATTVGYGDVVPESLAGRIVAGAVMVVGISFTSVLTGQIAAWLSRQDEEEADDRAREALFQAETRLAREVSMVREDVHRLHANLEQIGKRLDELSERTAVERSGDGDT